MAIKILTLLTLFTFLFFSTSVTSISTHDLDALLTLLRANGHSLFANAISTSDLLFDLLSLPSLTLLAPTDPSLFALDMTQTPSFYLSTLRLHALPRRLSWSSFLLLPNGSSLPTLLPSRQLRLTRRDGANVVLVVSTIGGGAVQLVMPGLFYSSHVAVHGLAGILTFRFKTGGGGGGGGSGCHPNRTVFLPPIMSLWLTAPLFLPRCQQTSVTTHIMSLRFLSTPLFLLELIIPRSLHSRILQIPLQLRYQCPWEEWRTRKSGKVRMLYVEKCEALYEV
ncbi:hypothetical protein Pint_32909 [Pistacia integerrima]|uniref:Uncharacterized protein n=1 Tax=Pistacia integerrima TaxID=434235 RepID=A0ACC0X982_9ROSI|nr:hypothetical protein Pint_32909 [Pistacia integerrima]